MKEVNIGAGCHISSACREAILAGYPCFFVFNDIRVEHLSEDDTPESLEACWSDASNKRYEAYLASPECKAAEIKRAREVSANQKTVDSLMDKRPFIDFSNQMEVLNWLNELAPLSDDVGVHVPSSQILKHFKKNGYAPGVFCGDAFVKGDKNIHARYLAGQALSCLQSMGAIHPVFQSMFESWKKEFG
jgi:hypothetical protein